MKCNFFLSILPTFIMLQLIERNMYVSSNEYEKKLEQSRKILNDERI